MKRLDAICLDIAAPGGAEEACHIIGRHGTVEREAREPPAGSRALDLRGTGIIGLPGLVDMHVHLRGLELSYKETVRTGTLAALRGGITLVADMPNTRPRLDTPEAIAARILEIAREAAVDVRIIAGIPRRPGDADRIARIPGVVAFKAYPEDLERPLQLMEAAGTGLPIILHPELPQAEGELERERLPSREAGRACHLEAASVGLLRDMVGPDAVLHVTHASCASTVREARRAGATVDVAPHHLIYDYYRPPGMSDCLGKVNPPLRGPVERSLLLREVLEGRVDALASDHAPHAPWEKSEPLTCASGIPWLELWPWAVASLLGGLGVWRALSTLSDLASAGPSRILGLPPRAVRGGEATYTLVRPVRWRFTGFEHSLAVRSYHFMVPLLGEPAGVVVRGRPVFIPGRGPG